MIVFLDRCASLRSAASYSASYGLDPIRPTDSFTIQSDPSAFAINDRLQEATLCTEKNKYICIVTSGFSFHVPKDLSKTVRSWSVDGFKYTSHVEERLQIFGIPDLIYVIDKNDADRTIRYLYSKNRGLIAFGGFSKKGSSLFLISSYCGFGASKDCKPRPYGG